MRSNSDIETVDCRTKINIGYHHIGRSDCVQPTKRLPRIGEVRNLKPGVLETLSEGRTHKLVVLHEQHLQVAWGHVPFIFFGRLSIRFIKLLASALNRLISPSSLGSNREHAAPIMAPAINAAAPATIGLLKLDASFSACRVI
jgi:hypothetical protein